MKTHEAVWRAASDRGRTLTLRPTLLLVVAWAAIDASVAVYLGIYGVNGASSALLAIGLAAFMLALLASGDRATSIIGAATVLLIAHLALRVIVPFRAEDPPPAPFVQVLAIGALGLLFAGASVARRSPRWIPVLLMAIIGLGLVARVAILLVDIAPPFDVPRIQEAAAAALRSGSDPYLTSVYQAGYPYLPVAALAGLLGSLAGDARWAVVAGDAMTVVGLAVAGHRMAVPRPLGLTLAALWTWSSGGLYVVWQGFPEPILTGFLALGTASMVGPRPWPRLAGVLLGLSLGTKQFGLGLLPFLGAKPKGRVALFAAVVVGLLCILPFAAWHPAEFAEGTFWSHLSEPGRPYALNLLSWPSLQLDVPPAICLGVALGVGWWSSRQVRDGDGAWLAGSGALLLVAFALNRIAFVNYYAIPLVLTLLLVLVRCRGDEEASSISRQ